jgi:hypothetical protein
VGPTTTGRHIIQCCSRLWARLLYLLLASLGGADLTWMAGRGKGYYARAAVQYRRTTCVLHRLVLCTPAAGLAEKEGFGDPARCPCGGNACGPWYCRWMDYSCPAASSIGCGSQAPRLVARRGRKASDPQASRVGVSAMGRKGLPRLSSRRAGVQQPGAPSAVSHVLI